MSEERKCETCVYSDSVGGDWVPYGSTYIQTPYGIVCTHEDMEDIDNTYEITNEGKDCQLWEVRIGGYKPKLTHYDRLMEQMTAELMADILHKLPINFVCDMEMVPKLPLSKDDILKILNSPVGE